MELRLLEHGDLLTRVSWMNDSRVNRTLNIQLPVTMESTLRWFERISSNDTREDYAFVEDGVLVAMGGFTGIDTSVGKAELYIFVHPKKHGEGYGTNACMLMCERGFNHLGLKKIYIHTNSDNFATRKLCERQGFRLEGFMPNEIINNGKVKDRCYYGLYNCGIEVAPTNNTLIYKDLPNFLFFHKVSIGEQPITIIRDDLFPGVGGGNKARKAVEYEKELRRLGCNALVTTGGIQSNHNRAAALLAAKNAWKCHIVYHGTEERFFSEKGNALLVRMTDATYEFVEASQIASAMDSAMASFRYQGLKPYYITGGGHDIPGGMAYVKAVQQLALNTYKPDYIFLASGTGSTQAGIMVGLELVGWSDVKVIGISVARQQERGKQVIADFANTLAAYCHVDTDFTDRVYFLPDYLCGGYEQFSTEMQSFIDKSIKETGIVFDYTYSGKALYGMYDYVSRYDLKGNILFWHTGGIMNTQK